MFYFCLHRTDMPLVVQFRDHRNNAPGLLFHPQLLTIFPSPRYFTMFPCCVLSFMTRRKKDGDRFRPTWRDRPAKLKDFLRGQGVPLHRREEVALICDQDDVVSAGDSYFCPCFPLCLVYVRCAQR